MGRRTLRSKAGWVVARGEEGGGSSQVLAAGAASVEGTESALLVLRQDPRRRVLMYGGVGGSAGDVRSGGSGEFYIRRCRDVINRGRAPPHPNGPASRRAEHVRRAQRNAHCRPLARVWVPRVRCVAGEGGECACIGMDMCGATPWIECGGRRVLLESWRMLHMPGIRWGRTSAGGASAVSDLRHRPMYRFCV